MVVRPSVINDIHIGTEYFIVIRNCIIVVRLIIKLRGYPASDFTESVCGNDAALLKDDRCGKRPCRSGSAFLCGVSCMAGSGTSVSYTHLL